MVAYTKPQHTKKEGGRLTGEKNRIKLICYEACHMML